jgi:hypothetical protein
MISKVAGLSFLSGFSHVRYKKTMQKKVITGEIQKQNKNHIYRTTIKTPQISGRKTLNNIPGSISDLNTLV